jgi:hypothetical protein
MKVAGLLSQLWRRPKDPRAVTIVGFWAGVLLGILILLITHRQAVKTTALPENVAKVYLKAVYAQDHGAAYQWISEKDRKYKSEADYLRENPPFSGRALELTRKLADMIESSNIQTETEGNKATVSFKVRLPNANAPEIQRLFFDFDPDRLVRLTEKEKGAIEEKISLMRKQGTLPTIEGEDSLKLIREQGSWRVLAGWAQAIPVRFSAEIKEGLPWEFRPVQEAVLAKPGETLRGLYKVKNLSDRPVTAKALHRDKPEGLADKYLEIVQCFCFIQQTLAPGEEKELPLIFRVNWDVPNNVKEFSVNYEFYPIDKFPKR